MCKHCKGACHLCLDCDQVHPRLSEPRLSEPRLSEPRLSEQGQEKKINI